MGGAVDDGAVGGGGNVVVVVDVEGLGCDRSGPKNVSPSMAPLVGVVDVLAQQV